MSDENEITKTWENTSTVTAEEVFRHVLSQMWESDNPVSYLTFKSEDVTGEKGPVVVYKLQLHSINGIEAKLEKESD